MGLVRILLRAVTFSLCSSSLSVSLGAADVSSPPIETILETSCTSCHRPGKAKGGLDLTTREALLTGGDTGPAIVLGKAADSLMYKLVAHLDEPGMPMKADKLPAQQIATMTAWINAGAPYARTLTAPTKESAAADGHKEPHGELVVGAKDREHWAFKKLSSANAPAVVNVSWVRGDLDRFILSRLEQNKLTPAPHLPRQGLIRRLYLDLVGLPPTPDQVQTAMNNPSPEWYEELVDTLLASPHFGERWGRHWLDLARYADSDGFEGDGDRPGAYLYRDFVVRSFNDDLPYDRFVKLQVAGDQIATQDPAAVAATGFCSSGPVVIFTGGAMEGTPEERERLRYDQLDDIVSTTSSTFLGLTMGCARCHDHKFDPLPIRDYYRMTAAFIGTENKGASYIKGFTKVDEKQKAIDLKTPYSLTDQAKPVKAYLLGRGDPTKKKEELSVGFLSVLSDGSFDRWTSSSGTPIHPRVAMANWLCDVEHGAGSLLARVIVNRLWKHHFGAGLVRTPNDVGRQGEPPTHPELLDWLAHQLIANGWRLKPIHRLMLLSSTYRLGVGTPATTSAAGDRLWQRRSPQRIEAEILRDSILSVSGQLKDDLYGPPVKTWIPEEARTGRDKDFFNRPSKDGPEQWRRSLYLFIKRSIALPFGEVFDAPAASASCGNRLPSTVATQALTLMNDPFVRNQARLFAERVRNEVGDSSEARVDRAVWLALGRAPSNDERIGMVEYVRQDSMEKADKRLIDLCHLLFTLNEFIYVD